MKMSTIRGPFPKRDMLRSLAPVKEGRKTREKLVIQM